MISSNIRREALSLPSDPTLRPNLEECIDNFLKKGGVIKCALTDTSTVTLNLNERSIVYPVCSGGWCRSQALWAYLNSSFGAQLTLMQPHAARYGWDPYNGQINRYLNKDKETWYDEYQAAFGIEKERRFGFENEEEWSRIEKEPTPEGLAKITAYYDKNYYGGSSEKERMRIYIVFEKNAHVVLKRLSDTNDRLDNVVVVAINWKDIMTSPPEHLNTQARSKATYDYFINQLKSGLLFSEI